MVVFSDIGVSIFGVMIRWYGLIIASAILMALILCTLREKRYGVPGETCLNLALLAVPFGIIGARVYYVLFNWEYYRANPIEMLFIHKGGLAIYGGIIAGVLVVLIYAKIKKLKFLKLADLIVPALALAQAMGRWGNFFNQEAYGSQVLNEAWQFFPAAIRLNGGSWHYATFFYESVWCAVIVIVLLVKEFSGRIYRDGDNFFAYLYLYAIERFLVEGLRMDSLMLGPIRVSQLLSIALIVTLDIAMCARGGSRYSAMKVILMLTPVLLVCAAALLPMVPAAITGIVIAVYAGVLYQINRPTMSE